MKGWGGWEQLRGGQAQPGVPVTAVSRSTDNLDVFVSAGERTFTAWWNPNDGWGGWYQLP